MGNGWEPEDFQWEVLSKINGKDFVPDENMRDLVCKNLRVQYLSWNKIEEENKRWQDRVRSTHEQKTATYGCHLKSYIVDDMVWYIGSQNLYPAPLQEFGVIIDDQKVTKNVVEKFWNPAWENSFGDSTFEYKKCLDNMKKKG